MNRMAASTRQDGEHGDCAGFNRTVRGDGALAALDQFNLISHHRNYPRGSIIQAQGEIGGIVGHIVDGVVKLTRTCMNGNEHIVGLVFPSGFFGQLFTEEMRFSYEAATDVTLCLVTRPAFQRFLANHPAVEHEMLKAKLDELDTVREWAAITKGHTSIQCLASLLYVFSKRSTHRESDGAPWSCRTVHVPLSRCDIADYLGTTPETLSRNIQTLARRKVIRIINAKQYELLDVNELIQISGESRSDLDRIASV